MDHSDEFDIRSKKREDLIAHGYPSYPCALERTHTCRDIGDMFDTLEASGKTVILAGRVRSIRRHGGSSFIVVDDSTASLQLFLRKDILADTYALVSQFLDIGDFIQCTGALMRTKTGEKTLHVESFAILAKALRPLPEQWHGLSDIEARYRHRELDLIANEAVRERFVVRARMITALRRFFDEHGFIEVETPILQPIPGGANARPFMTHHNALDADLYLRIAPELYLKRLIIGGFEKVYEIGRLFRNEGIDHAHSPEFTSAELYWAYVPHKDVFVSFLEDALRTVVISACGTTRIIYDGTTIDFSLPWKRMTFREALIEHTGIDIDLFRDEATLVAEVKRRKLSVSFDSCVGIGEHYDQLYKKTAREALSEPTWIFDYPLELKPLAKQSPDDPFKSASVQLIIRGEEIVNAYYHELNDPVEQRARFLEQDALRARGSADAQFLDNDFLFALEHGMPPTSGVGIGVDRLAMLLTGQTNMKEVILFPTLRPR
jgi:lysyl-tRNA synthetase class 2